MTEPPSYQPPPIVAGRPAEPYNTLATVIPASRPPRRPGWVIPVTAGLVVLVLLGGGVTAWVLLRPTTAPVASQPTRDIPVDVAAPPPPAPPAKTYAEPSTTDFDLTIKVLEKKCFGSAGCNVTYNIQVQYNGRLMEPGKVWDVTYEVKGGDDPQVNTLQLTGTSDGYSTKVQREERISTPGSSSTLTATVTAVSAH